MAGKVNSTFNVSSLSVPAPLPDPPEEDVGPVMTIWDHIDELRQRLLRIVLSLLLGMTVSAFVTNQAIVLLMQSSGYGKPLLITTPTDSVVIFFRVALMLGAVLASPLITYQIFMFVIPGLTRQERRWVLLALPGTTLLFLLGLIFTWTFLLPAYVNFLTSFNANIFETLWTADAYIGFVTAVLIWHAAAFETPLVFYVLARLGMVNARNMIVYWRQAIVGAAVIAAVITPTVDPITMIVITLILMALYLISIVLVYAAQKREPRAPRVRRTRQPKVKQAKPPKPPKA